MRRVAAVVLPSLFVELAERKRSVAPQAIDRAHARPPLVVVLGTYEGEAHEEGRESGSGSRDAGSSSAKAPDDRTTVVAAVDPAARALGVRPGLKLSEAHAMVAHLEVVSVARTEVENALRALAEAALGFSPTVEVQPFDTVWIDVTGVAHLFGGEEELVRAIEMHVQAMGHEARVGLGDGPRIAEALARYGHAARRIAAPGGGAEALAPLPIAALPLPVAARAFFGRLGVLTVGDLAKLPRKQVAARLSSPKDGRNAGQEVLLLVHGFDPRPLRPFVLPEHLEENVSFEDGVSFTTQLLFAASGMTSRLEGRLRGRGQAAHGMEIVVTYDRAIHALRTGSSGSSGASKAAFSQAPSSKAASLRAEPSKAASSKAASSKAASPKAASSMTDSSSAPCVAAAVAFPAPLARSEDLFRTVKAKIEHLDIVAPVRSITIVLRRLVTAPRFQLDLSRDVAADPDALPALLSELVADLGADRVGILLARNEILPERRSRLAPATDALGHAVRPRRARSRPDDGPVGDADPEPVRLLSSPLPVGTARLEGDRVWIDATTSVQVGGESYRVADVSFDRRIDAAHWWTNASASRDYYRIMLALQPTHGRRVVGADRARGAAIEEPDGEAIVGGEAWVFVERRSGDVYLQGFWE